MLAVVLLAVPNVSEGRDPAVIERIAAAFAPARVLDIHTDSDHNRSVFWLAAEQGVLAEVLAAGARACSDEIDVSRQPGVHPRVGALDVAPVVFLDELQRGAAIAEALTAATLVGELGIPVFLYGDLSTQDGCVERADIRRGGPDALQARLDARELRPDYGPAQLHPTAGATLVTARPPLIAFNVELDSTDLELAKSVAAEIRESGGGFPGLRAIGLELASRARVQVSMNVHDYPPAPPDGQCTSEAADRRAATAPASVPPPPPPAPLAEAFFFFFAPAAALA